MWATFEAGTLRHPEAPMYLLGGTSIVFAFVYAHADGSWAMTQLLKWLLLVVVGIAICYGGYRVQAEEIDSRRALWVFFGTLAFLGLGLCLSSIVFLISVFEGAYVPNAEYLLVLSGYASAAVGAPISFYQQRLSEERENTRRLNKRLTILHRTFRHNLRNEISIVRGYLERMVHGDEAARYEAHGKAQTHIGHVEDLIDTTKSLRLVWEEPKTVDTNLTETTERSIDAVREQYENAVVDAELPPEVMVSAHHMLETAITEVLTNAIVHNDDSVVIEVALSREEAPRGFVELRIRDTGSGIPEGELEALRRSRETAMTHGTGLGLWLVYWVVEASDGELAFSETESGGTEVTFHLPTRASV